MSKPDPIIGTWDAYEDAKAILEASGLSYCLTVSMPGTRFVCTKTNMLSPVAWRWMRKQVARHSELLTEQLDPE